MNITHGERVIVGQLPPPSIQWYSNPLRFQDTCKEPCRVCDIEKEAGPVNCDDGPVARDVAKSFARLLELALMPR